MSANFARTTAGTVLVLATLATPVAAQVAKKGDGALDRLVRPSQRLAMAPDFAPLEEARDKVAPDALSALEVFAPASGASWVAHVDRRSGRVGVLTGSGMPWIPGDGNTLRDEDVRELLAGEERPTLATLERKAREVAPELAKVFGFDARVAADPLRAAPATPRRTSGSSTSTCSSTARWSKARGWSSP